MRGGTNWVNFTALVPHCSMEHTMEAMFSFQQLSQTVPQLPLRWTSNLPEQRSAPPVSLIALISAQTQKIQTEKLVGRNKVKIFYLTSGKLFPRLWDLNIWHQHPPCVHSRAPPVQPDRSTGSALFRCSSAHRGGWVLCLGGRSRPGPSHWGRNHSRAGRTPRWHPSGPTGRHILCPISRLSTAPPVQHSGLGLLPAAQDGGLRATVSAAVSLLFVSVYEGQIVL